MMNCKSAKTWLLEAEDLDAASWPTEVACHLQGCAACAEMAATLRDVEEAYRNQPLPLGCAAAKAVFLRELPRAGKKGKKTRKDRPTTHAPRRWFPVRLLGAAAAPL